MKQRWTLLVENLGKIRKAEIQVRPLMMFVGENNSGKSYLATILWGLSALRKEIFPNKEPSSDAFKECEKWINTRLPKGGKQSSTFEMKDSDYNSFVNWFNDLLKDRKTEIIQRIFNSKSLDIGRLEIRDYHRSEPLLLKWEISEKLAPGKNFVTSRSANSINFKIPPEGEKSTLTRYRMIRYIVWQLLMQELAAHFYQGETENEPVLGEPVFLPAARTGFMLMYKAVVGYQLDQLSVFEDAESNRIEFTLPAVKLLKLLAVGLKPTRGPYAEEADYLETNALQGSIELSTEQGTNQFFYRVPGSSNQITMSLSSALVTEVAPIVLVLRHMKAFHMLVLEEPEAHLHPGLQRILARVIARLIRKGLFVLITTHSETFCQQINNFIKLGSHPMRERLQQEFGYEEQDYLEQSEVAGYQFVNADHHSEVTPLKETEQGFVMPTFNEELMSLVRETRAFQKRTEG